ncbi:nucleotidyltransferase family protein [Segetibacter aerophilus]|uniref:Mannose-1-phosphate guanylyltransferase n=1 Tax=Segetibacter aerophilus TaxID=670293 RepID=A0A512BI33_9BACT|nr:sugar phosphate nucleotidyltransferase [Segetibacter aerophilus]GEO11611.1 mannose-1-phosphate guanylyltransferase [Segetibacter aerophilus]
MTVEGKPLEAGSNIKGQKTVTKAMILAAGVGSRLKPWTDFHPKALALIHGKSLLQRNVEYLQRYGIKDVVVNVHHFAEQIIDAITKNHGWGSNITISDETEKVLETGGGLLKAAGYLNETNPIVLMNVDILTELNLEAMIGYHQEKKPLATLATTDRTTSRYFLFDEGNNLCGWRNVHTGEERVAQALKGNEAQKAFSGIHIIEPKIFSFISQQGKFSMVDVYLDLMKEHTIKSFDHSDARLIDVGKPDSIAKAEVMFAV